MNAGRSAGHAAALVGLLLLAGFVALAGPEAILGHVRRLGTGLLWLLGLALAWRVLETSAMWCLFPNDARPRWSALFAVRTFGESLNMLTPLMGMGGEPIKALLLRGHVGHESSTGYVLLDKTVFFVASVLFMLSGATAALWIVGDRSLAMSGGCALALLWLLGLVWLARTQARGHLVASVVGLLGRLGVQPSHARLAQLEAVDATLRRAYAQRRPQLRLALAVHFAGRVLRVVDVWLCAWLLDVPVSWGAAYVVAAAGTLIGAAFAFIPGALGAYEGGQALVLARFGVDMSAGVTLGLVRHLRNWVMAALLYTSLYFAARRVSQDVAPPANLPTP